MSHVWRGIVVSYILDCATCIACSLTIHAVTRAASRYFNSLDWRIQLTRTNVRRITRSFLSIHSFEGNKNPNIFPFTSHFTFEFLLSSRTQRRRMIKMIVSSLQRLVPFDAIINYLERKIATSYRSSTVPIRFKRQLGNPSASTTLTEKSIYLQSRRIDKRIYP